MSKIATDLEQSKRLREILPAESADMVYPYNPYDPSFYFDVPSVRCGMPNDDYDILAWSLSALIDVLPRIDIEKELWSSDKYDYRVKAYIGDGYVGEWFDNPIDACVEIILKLKEKNLI